jgi:hypothetical protein
LEESPLQVLEVDKLVSGSGHHVTRILFAKPVPTFAECAPKRISRAGMLPARFRDFPAMSGR